ncbi:unnamed protein product, partial [Urochloa humidicola]
PTTAAAAPAKPVSSPSPERSLYGPAASTPPDNLCTSTSAHLAPLLRVQNFTSTLDLAADVIAGKKWKLHESRYMHPLHHIETYGI